MAEQEEQDRGEEAQAAGDKMPMPEPSISVIISSLTTQALIGLGVMGHPISKKKGVDLDSARFSIDLLEVLQEKTQGNLTDGERRFLETVLHDLRMKFVEAKEQ
jgi:hypothetical protein